MTRRPLLASLRSRLVLLVFLAGLPSLGLILYGGIEQRRHAASLAKDNASRLARLAASEQEQLVTSTRQFLMMLAEVPAVRERDAAQCTALFAKLLTQRHIYANIGAIAPDGLAFASGVPLTNMVDLSDRLYFRHARDTREFAVGEYQIGRITGKATVNFGCPVLDESSNVTAVVFAALDLSWLNQLAAGAQLAKGCTLSVIDGSGKVLVRFPDGEQWVGRDVSDAPITKTVLSQHEGTTEVRGMDGVERLFAFTPLTREAQVYVYVGIPTRLAFAEANRTLARNLITLGVVAALALLAAWLGGNLFILGRVRQLVSTAKQLEDGNLSVRTRLSEAGGEIGQIGRAIDQMATSLEQREAERQRAATALRALNEDLEHRVAERTADLAATNRGLQEENAERVRVGQRLSLQYGLSRILADSPTLAEAAPKLLEGICQHLGWDLGAFWELDTVANVLRCVEVHRARGLRAGEFESATRQRTFARGDGLPGRAWESGEPVWIPDVAQDTNFPRALFAALEGFHGAFAFPILLGREVHGVIEFFSREIRQPDQGLLRMFGAIGNQIGQFMERRDAEEALRAAESKYRLLVEQLPTIIYIAEFGAEGRWLYVSPRIESVLGFSAEEWMANPKLWLERLHADDRERALAAEKRSSETGQPFRCEYRMLAADGRVVWCHDEAMVLRDSQGRPRYVQGFIMDVTKRRLAEEQLAQFAAALQGKNEQVQADLRMAREIQSALLPQKYPSFPPNAPAGQSALRFTHRYLPTGAVGGDFFDVLQVSDTEAGVFICDVMGHGMRAALVTAVIRGLVEELSPLAFDAGQFLTDLNRGLMATLKNVDAPLFASAFYLVANVRTGELSFANAGHPWPLHVRRGARSVEPLHDAKTKAGPALGLFGDSVYQTAKRPMVAGDLIVLFTDGVYEVCGSNDREFGQSAVAEAVRLRLGLSCVQMFNELLAEIRQFSERREFSDDVCLVGMDVMRIGVTPAKTSHEQARARL